MGAIFSNTDTPGSVRKAAFAGVAIFGRECRHAEMQVGIAFADGVDVRQAVDHHTDTAIGEFFDFVLFLHGEGARSDYAGIIHFFDEFNRAFDIRIGQVRLAVFEHALARSPHPGHNIVLNTIGGFQGKRQDPAVHVLIGIGHSLGGIKELGACGRDFLDTGGIEQIGIDEDRIDEIDDRDHVGGAVQFNLGSQFAVIIAGFSHQSGQVGNRTLFHEIRNPGAIQTYHIRHRAGGSASDNLFFGGRIRAAQQRYFDARIFGFELIHHTAQCAFRQFRFPPLSELKGHFFTSRCSGGGFFGGRRFFSGRRLGILNHCLRSRSRRSGSRSGTAAASQRGA